MLCTHSSICLYCWHILSSVFSVSWNLLLNQLMYRDNETPYAIPTQRALLHSQILLVVLCVLSSNQRAAIEHAVHGPPSTCSYIDIDITSCETIVLYTDCMPQVHTYSVHACRTLASEYVLACPFVVPSLLLLLSVSPPCAVTINQLHGQGP